ncbi:MAG: CoA-binding protein [Alphaproteobacteria bacterium]|nr:MAG: CoA-binding protein [Alphaproteobacteria bacterium]
MTNKNEKVIVFGYSDNPERYSNMAYNLLKEFDHDAIKFNPREQALSDLPKSCDTLTLYVSEAISNKFRDVILGLQFKRVSFNPGTENAKLEKILIERGVEVVHGCTLVMLRTDQF